MRRLLLALALALPAAAAQDYTQPLRPQVHFSPAEHWMNDPNGLVYFQGEYHLFFQYNPFDLTPGHISWGHAVSKDLLHWQQLPVAIPATETELVFTGSVVIDEHNTSRLCLDGKPCMVAIYTAHTDVPHHEAQALAVSQDRGRTWQRYAANPVLDLHLPEFRDPAVTWHEPTKSWVMAVSLPNDHQALFFVSPDLIHWTKTSAFGPAGTTTQYNKQSQWECPDLLKIPAANKARPPIWALKVGLNPGSIQGGSGEQYFLGDFDGKAFTQSTLPGSNGWTDYGKDSYCAISFNHLPPGSNPTLIGWMDNWAYADKLPTSPWRGQMTLPRTLTYMQDAAGLALIQQPVTAPLRIGPGKPLARTIPVQESMREVCCQVGDDAPSILNTTAPIELTLTFQPADATRIGVRLLSDLDHYTEILFDLTANTLTVNRTKAGGPVPNGGFDGHLTPADPAVPIPNNFPARVSAPIVRTRPLDLHIIADRSSIEVFAQGHTIALTNLVLPPTTQLHLETVRDGGTHPAHLTGHTWPLKSIWPKP